MKNYIYYDDAPIEGGNGGAVSQAPEQTPAPASTPVPEGTTSVEPGFKLEKKTAFDIAGKELVKVPLEPHSGDAGSGDVKPAPSTPAGTATTPPITPNIPGLTAEQARAIGIGVVDGLKQAQPKTQPQMTPEQFKKAFNVFEVNEEWIQKVANSDIPPAEKAAMYNQFVMGTVKQALTMATAVFNERLNQYHQSLSPVFQAYQQQENVRLESKFFDKHPDLKPFRSICAMVTNDARSKGLDRQFTGKEDEAIEYVANQVRQVIKDTGLSTESGNTKTVPGKPTTPARKMPTLAGAGHGGTRSGNSGSTENEVESLWK